MPSSDIVNYNTKYNASVFLNYFFWARYVSYLVYKQWLAIYNNAGREWVFHRPTGWAESSYLGWD
jgi:hypothetical protein